MSPQAEFTIGVEEEYQIINPQTRQLSPAAQQVLPIAQSALGYRVVQPEFRQCQIELAIPVCRSLQEVRDQLTHSRREMIAAANQTGNQLAAAGTHPFSHWQAQSLTPKPSYQQLVHNYRRLMHELVTFGCHIHIGLSDREMAIQVMNRARVWLAPMLALSASSPFWLGTDTGYASYRTSLISRLPMAGPPHLFASYSEYQTTVRALMTTHTIQNGAQVCWDLRLSERFPTLEFRVTDVCMTVDEAVLIAGLARGLVRTCYEHVLSNTPYLTVRPELLNAAHWCAARSGLEADLIDLEKEQSVPAETLIKQFLEFVQSGLQAFGDCYEVSALAHKVIQQGTGAARQRAAYRSTRSLEEVVDFIIRETTHGL